MKSSFYNIDLSKNQETVIPSGWEFMRYSWISVSVSYDKLGDLMDA